jgi:2-amino-4-hydroxy-6-hydroxymethyldihydropteridine diphosphokinase
MAEALLGLGGNVGEVRAALDEAVALLADGKDTTLRSASSQYLTPPWGVLEQPRFTNMAIAVDTTLSARALLERAMNIESAFDRDRYRERRWGPRPVDIDLLSYDNLVVNEPGLILPHPRLFERAFVLVPLNEIVPGRLIAGRSIKDALAALDDRGIERLPPLPSSQPRTRS